MFHLMMEQTLFGDRRRVMGKKQEQEKQKEEEDKGNREREKKK